MKILVDVLPDSCSECLFCKIVNRATDRSFMESECKLTESNNIKGDYEILNDCPLEEIKDNLSVNVQEYDEWDAKYREVTVRFKDVELYNDKQYIGSSGWRDE